MISSGVAFVIICSLFFLARHLMLNTYVRYMSLNNSRMLTGEELAMEMAKAKRRPTVSVEYAQGVLTDHYNAISNTVYLSSTNFYGRSIGALAIATHEVGHACQTFHSRFLPSISYPVCALTGFLTLVCNHKGTILLFLAYIPFAALQLVVLLVELNASRRAKRWIRDSGKFTQPDYLGACKVLNAAAFTYVAVFFTCLIHVLHLSYLSKLLVF